ncbi:protein tkr, partial [Lasius niger]
MVEIPKDCVLQWAGHAGYITERFSGLLARQALVDVTLICDEQKLRVHKLVLASNSIYFEEILQQDLGQEPIILLHDLDFEILKAMVEFMYCGETTISHQHLSSLHTAAQIFKVKKLVSVIDTIVGSKKILDDFGNCLKQQREDCNLNVANGLLMENDYVCVKCDKLISMDENIFTGNNNNDVSSAKNQSFENDMTEATEHDVEHTLYEESDAIDTSKEDVDTPFSISDVDIIESDLEHCSGSSTDVPSIVGKCVKVYTPKRRKSIDEVRNKLVYTQCNLVPTPPHSTDSIDLLDEPSANDLPVTLLTSLDMESAEYILSLSTESIQSIVGGTISDQHTVIGCRGINAEEDVDKRLNTPTSDTDCAKPILRRSTRLNQQESDEAVNNGFSSGTFAGTEKPFKKGNSPNRTESCAKAKRKGKEDRKVPDHSTIASSVQSNKKSSNSRKSNSKLMVRKSNKPACTVASSKEKEESRPREEGKSRTNNKFKADTERLATSDQQSVVSSKSNTCECINRALWGDMSDTLDCWESEDLHSYPSNTEIPFAVGLLPLRTALEKMQAMPDYQPRKTRSSVAPLKQDAANSQKRKNCAPLDVVVPSKKQNGNNNNESPNTVYHIEIRTASSQCVKSRKRFLPDSITSLPATDVAN